MVPSKEDFYHYDVIYLQSRSRRICNSFPLQKLRPVQSANFVFSEGMQMLKFHSPIHYTCDSTLKVHALESLKRTLGI